MQTEQSGVISGTHQAGLSPAGRSDDDTSHINPRIEIRISLNSRVSLENNEVIWINHDQHIFQAREEAGPQKPS